jgi:hypothetical protein
MIKMLKTNALDKKMSISSINNQRYQGNQNLGAKKNNTSVMNPFEEYKNENSNQHWSRKDLIQRRPMSQQVKFRP